MVRRRGKSASSDLHSRHVLQLSFLSPHLLTSYRQTVLPVDFACGYFQFPELCLNLPGGISFALKKYWHAQPARLVCSKGRGGVDLERLFLWSSSTYLRRRATKVGA